jgi:hypothetical protein
MKEDFIKDVDAERLEVLRRLPKSIVEKLTKEEIRAFLSKNEWPDSLKEKLKDYLEDL